ncbi:ABC transporter permease [Streptomonospora litoralis]|uniref:Dipeptide transport system permease protein DppB n=1 Tax=Streptomonospora litoralis TaxID=2498135 RepID=A0A4P6PY51_9ACTN|nr:ABC transporter permease [Streptomonospora litoralis]QBI53148.1 Dipeptide transport system permease protein DppB [Streptomonospora litoralis]
MAKFLIRRLLSYLVLIFLASSIAYLIAATTLSPSSYFRQQQPPPSEQAIEQQLEQLNLNPDTPLAERYATWVSGVVVGDFGRTITNESVNEAVARKAGVTLRLITAGTLIGATVGVAVGAYSAVRQYGRFDRSATVAAFFLMAVPAVVVAVTLQVGAVMINDAAGYRLLEYGGEYSANLEAGFWGHLLDRIQHGILPTLALSLSLFAVFSRYQRNMMLDVLGSDFVRTAMAKGLTRRAAMLKHALRTALIPTITYFTFTVGILMANATFTEKIFGWHGMGAWVVDSIVTNDVNAVAAVTCFMAVCVMAASFLSDVLYAWLDPRVRVS